MLNHKCPCNYVIFNVPNHVAKSRQKEMNHFTYCYKIL